MINKTFLDAYDNLTINDKRNELCNELIIISEYIKHIELCLNYHNDKFCIENYDIIDDKSQDESQTLTEFYEKVYLIERELELVIDLMHKTLQ